MRIAIIGDYDQNRPSHVATSECLRRTSSYVSEQIETEWLPTLTLEVNHALAELQDFLGIPIKFQVESMFTQEQYDVVIM